MTPSYAETLRPTTSESTAAAPATEAPLGITRATALHVYLADGRAGGAVRESPSRSADYPILGASSGLTRPLVLVQLASLGRPTPGARVW
jgi:hypothetical protein